MNNSDNDSNDDDGDDDSSVVSSDDEDEGIGRNGSRKRQRQMETLYGSFLDDDEDDDHDDRRRARSSSKQGSSHYRPPKRPRGSNNNKQSSSSSSAPLFVKTTRAESPNLNEPAIQEDTVTTGSKSGSQQEQQTEPIMEELEEENDEEQQEQRRQAEAANQHFLELLQKAKGGRRTSSSIAAAPPPATTTRPYLPRHSSPNEPSALEANASANTTNSTLLRHHFANSAGLSSFSSSPSLSSPQPKKPKATWEKHTKGIGSKLLAKMGYTGQGGLKRTRTIVTETGQALVVPTKNQGIDAPIQVKVRPNGLGLGFGNFKEASSIKENRRLEAKVRGVEEEQEEPVHHGAQTMGGNSKSSLASSALPSVRDLFKDQGWKRNKKRKRKVVSYKELLEKQQSSSEQQQKQVIIDMRGPQQQDFGFDEDLTATGTTSIPLGTELLHNVSLLLNTYENKVYSTATFFESTKRKLASLESDRSNLEQRRIDAKERTQKLRNTQTILNRIQQLIDSEKSGDISVLNKVQQLIKELGATFNAQERADLKFSEILLPALLGSYIQSNIMEQWKPLEDSLEHSKQIITSILSSSLDRNDESLEPMRNLLQTSLVPKLRTTLQSVRWDPVHDVDVALDLYELLVQCLSEFEESRGDDGAQLTNDTGVFGTVSSMTKEESASLVEMTKEILIHDVVYNRLSAAVSQWKPQLDESSGRLVNRIDLWVIPWLPHLDHKALLPHLVSDCKRKIRTTMEHIQKHVKHDRDFFPAAIETLRPWRGVFKESTLNEMVSSNVVPRLARYLRAMKVEMDLKKQDWIGVDAALELNNARLLSNVEFLSLLEGEVMWVWCDKIHSKLVGAKVELSQVTDAYVSMKSHLRHDLEYPAAWRCLYEDEVICRQFYAVLLMIRAVADAKMDGLDALVPSEMTFRGVLARRAKEEKQRISDDLVRMEGGAADLDMEARVRLRRSGQTPTFREVVEAFADERSISFKPRTGCNATKDGKQIFVFGEIPIYFDNNVVFALKDGDWSAISLQHLVDRDS
jgi:tuftelin-interacting protein 11